MRVSKACLIALAALYWLSQGKAHAARSCAELFEGPRYQASDFIESVYRPKSADPDHQSQYAAWAARSTNWAFKALQEGTGPAKVLETLGESRRVLAKKLNQESWEYFGQWRDRESFTNLGALPFAQKDSPAVRGIYDLFWSRSSRMRREDGTNVLRVANRYRMGSGLVIEGSLAYLKDGDIVIQHPSPRNAQLIIADVLSRVTYEKIQTTEDFAYAMYGFYNAMPFSRGSSAMGRVFFAAYYKVLFGRKIPALEDGVDVLAMILSERDFVYRITRQLDSD